jgi:branched-chain amino acid transport system permease protein
LATEATAPTRLGLGARLPVRAIVLTVLSIILVVLAVWGTYLTLQANVFTGAQWRNLVVLGIAQGSLYALIAMGYTLVYGILFMINFAHGEVFMAGAFTSFFVARTLNRSGFMDESLLTTTLSILLLLAVSCLVSVIVAVLLERIAYRPLRGAPRLVPLITAIGASLFLQYTFRGMYGSQVQGYPRPAGLEGNWNVPFFSLFGICVVAALGFLAAGIFKMTGGKGPEDSDVRKRPIVLFGIAAAFAVAAGVFFFWADITEFITDIPVLKTQVFAVVAAVLLVVGLYLFITRTRAGRSMRAVGEDKEIASLMGINVDKVIVTTFIIGGSLAGAAGLLWAFVVGQVGAFMGFIPGIKAFTAAVLGGIGNVVGAALGGLMLGVLESVAPFLLLTGLDIPGVNQLKDAIAFIVLVVVLIFRPGGILGSPEEERA